MTRLKAYDPCTYDALLYHASVRARVRPGVSILVCGASEVEELRAVLLVVHAAFALPLALR